ncbi:MAG: hypothetical protein IPH66_11950 [Crocinitomicaceae bacterium]|nr:hypothetical protein [Crocinitomicaceae bacterium]
MQKQAPGWGKAIGILMIIFGSFGVFIQIYKIIIPSMLKLQNRMMHSFSSMDMNGEPNPFRESQEVFDELLYMSDTQANVMMVSGILGFILCVFYIVGGVKLLKPKPAHYKFALYSLFAFLGLNALTCILLFASGPSIVIIGILVYVIMGLVMDLVYTIILATSDKTKYGIGVPESADTVYTPDDVLQ